MSFPNFVFWSHLLATVGIEVCCLAVLGFAAQRFLRPAVWQRAAWQIIVICLLLLPASEWTGLGRGTASFLFGQKPTMERAASSGVEAVKSRIAGQIVVAKLNPPTAAPPVVVWWPGWVWLAGTILVLVRIAVSRVFLLMLRLRRGEIADLPLQVRIQRVASCVGLRRKVTLLRMPQAISPMAFGIFRPSIGLPPELESKLSATEQEAVLAHELAHLAAMDPLWFLLGDLATAILWWHPMGWWACRSLHGAAELAADEATTLVPNGPDALAACLVSLGKEMTASGAWGWIGINGGFRSKLGKRVERLMHMASSAKRPLAGWLSAVARMATTILIVPTIVLLFGAIQSVHVQKGDSWHSQFEESWRQSPAGVILLARRNDDAKPNATNEVENAKFLYEQGKYDEAETILEQVIREDPSNRTPPYYLDLIKEARYVGQPGPNPMWNTNLVQTTMGRQQILSKLNAITLNEVTYDLPLKDVLVKLRKESQARDPDGIGINFMIDNNVESPPLLDTGGAVVPPTVGAQQQDIGAEVTIRIMPPLTNLRLSDVLEAITKVADKPIRYTVQNSAIVFSPKPPDQFQQLQTKTFRVNPQVFTQHLKELYPNNLTSGKPAPDSGFQIDDGPRRASGEHDAFGGPSAPVHYHVITAKTNESIALHGMLKQCFADAGVDLSPPKNVFFNDRLGTILVRATVADMELIQAAIEVLNQSPPQIVIEAKFVELTEQEVHDLGTNWLVSHSTNTAGPSTGDSSARVGIMSSAEFRIAINVIEQRTHADVLSTPKMITESGRQAHIGVGDKGENGVALDILPEVGPDGFSISMAATPRINSDKQTWQGSASQKLWDGQTLVIGGKITNQPAGARKTALVFITPIIVDAAGNRVHADDEISKHAGVPTP